MELMSSLLLCALVALLPRTLGAGPELKSEVRMSDMKILGQSIPRMKVLLKPNAQLVSSQSELQSVFTDLMCTKCISCMERALKANKIQTHIAKIKPNTQEIENDVIVSYYHYKPSRNKRSTESIDGKSISNQTTPRKDLLKRNKSVTVTKYNNDGQIYAVKIQEGNLVDGQDTGAVSTCEVYSVKKYFPCNSLAGELMLTTAKRKLHKRIKKVQERKPSLTTERALYETQSKAAKRLVKTNVSSIRVQPFLNKCHSDFLDEYNDGLLGQGCTAENDKTVAVSELCCGAGRDGECKLHRACIDCYYRCMAIIESSPPTCSLRIY